LDEQFDSHSNGDAFDLKDRDSATSIGIGSSDLSESLVGLVPAVDEFDAQSGSEFSDHSSDESDESNISPIEKELYSAGLYKHLISNFGGGKSESYSKTAIRRLVDLLIWTHNNANNINLNCKSTLLWFSEIISKFPQQVTLYMEHLLNNVSLKAATIKIYSYDIDICSVWYCCYLASEYRLPEFQYNRDYPSWNNVLKMIRKKCARLTRSDNSSASVEV
jgi:hypothetical protein